jgi:hypothetical protein
MFFKDGVYSSVQPKMVSTVRPPLLPDGYSGPDASVSNFTDVITNPWYIACIVVAIVIILWLTMKK